MVEFAIVLPILIAIILGILYFGRYESYSNQETQLAEEAARWAAVDANPSGNTTKLQAYVVSLATPDLQATSSDVTSAVKVYAYYPTGSTGAVGTQVRSCVTATVSVPFLGASYTIAQNATMRVEQAQTAPPASTGSTGWTPDVTANVPSQCPKS
jgi:Flp pilus assembly protein TadG